MQKTIKRTAMVALLAGVMQFGGCGFFNFQRLARDFATNAAYDFVANNDNVFDLFEAGQTTTVNADGTTTTNP